MESYKKSKDYYKSEDARLQLWYAHKHAGGTDFGFDSSADQCMFDCSIFMGRVEHIMQKNGLILFSRNGAVRAVGCLIYRVESGTHQIHFSGTGQSKRTAMNRAIDAYDSIIKMIDNSNNARGHE